MHGHHHGHTHGTTKNIRLAFFLNLGFTLLEIVGGILTNSVAILSDALHDLGDSIALGLAWRLENYAQKKPNKRYSYGYGRFSLLGALINTIILIVGSLIILSEAIPRLLAPEEAHAPGMIGFAIGGILINGLAALRLRGDQSLNAQAVAWHMLEDVLGWVGVLVVGITLLFVDLYILDPILSILITLYVLFNVIKTLRKTLALFLQATPEHIDLEAISQQLASLENVQSTHHTHVWSLDGDHHVLTTHLVVPDTATKADILRVKAEAKAIIEPLHLGHVTLEVEYESEGCSMGDC